MPLRFRFSPPALPSPRAEADDAGTDWPAAMSLEPLSGREGLEEEKRRWWPRAKTGTVAAAALGAEEAREQTRPAWGAEATTRRTDEGNMASPGASCDAVEREERRCLGVRTDPGDPVSSCLVKPGYGRMDVGKTLRGWLTASRR